MKGNECFFWRTTGCVFGSKCRYRHVLEHEGIDLPIHWLSRDYWTGLVSLNRHVLHHEIVSHLDLHVMLPTTLSMILSSLSSIYRVWLQSQKFRGWGLGYDNLLTYAPTWEYLVYYSVISMKGSQTQNQMESGQKMNWILAAVGCWLGDSNEWTLYEPRPKLLVCVEEVHRRIMTRMQKTNAALHIVMCF